MERRSLIKHTLGTALASSAFIRNGLGAQAGNSVALKKARVVVIGGGYGGTTASKYLGLFSNHQIQVTLIEPDSHFVSCPLSNLVIGGSKQKMVQLSTFFFSHVLITNTRNKFF